MDSSGTFPEILKGLLIKYPKREAIIYTNNETGEEFSITYEELFSLVVKSANMINNLGLKNGDAFAILIPNSPEVLVLEMAGSFLGTPAVPIDFDRDTLEKKLYKIKETKAKAIFAKVENGVAQKQILQIRKALPDVKIFQWNKFEKFKKGIGQTRINKSGFPGKLSDIFIILYTSGTTAFPKGVVLSLKACLSNAYGIIKWQGINNSDRFNIVLPLYHINSTIFSLATLVSGGTVILNSKYSSRSFWGVIKKYDATITSVVPTILHDLLNNGEGKIGKTTLKRICIGSAPVNPHEIYEFYKRFKIKVFQGYGQTETALRVTGVPTNINEKTYLKLVNINTIGKSLENCDVEIMDANNLKLKEGVEGEICINGPVLANGYLGNYKETKKAFKKGWFHSGDLGFWKKINGEKLFFIKGRIKEIIIKGGINISPLYIENALAKSFPEIDQVCVVGFPDTRMGEEIAAVFVLKKEALKESFIKKVLKAKEKNSSKTITRYEFPQKIFFVNNLPKTATGKVQRVEVRKKVIELMKKEETKRYFIKKINHLDKQNVKRALEINNQRFKYVFSTYKEFRSRAKNGVMFGVFEEKKGLVGSISCLRLDLNFLRKVKSWKDATENGTFKNNKENGNTLVCASISVSNNDADNSQKINSGQFSEKILLDLAKEKSAGYLKSDKDFVLNFHKLRKAGIKGALIWRILENGRSEDKESIGYNVLMKYPRITKSTKLTRSNLLNARPGIILVESAIYYAKENGIENIIAFSRPAGFRTYLKNLLKS